VYNTQVWAARPGRCRTGSRCISLTPTRAARTASPGPWRPR
jgi:hypothetical protein